LLPSGPHIALVAFIATFATSRIVSLASLIATSLLPILLLWCAYPTSYIWAGMLIAVLVIMRHKENIIRLLKGEESKFSFAKSSPPAA